MNMMDLSFKYADDQVSFHNHFIKLNIETLNNNFHTFKHTKDDTKSVATQISQSLSLRITKSSSNEDWLKVVPV